MSKWRCVSRKMTDVNDFTIGKVYELNKDGTMKCDNGYTFGTVPHPNGTIQ